MAISSTYALSDNGTTVTESTGSAMNVVVSTLSAPLDAFGGDAATTLVTKQRAGVQTVLGFGLGVLAKMGWDKYRPAF